VNILLISAYELGRQPFGLASPAAWLRDAGHNVRCQDLAQEKLSAELVRDSAMICFYLPMHTATRIAVRAIARVREWNPAARICCYGLYAPMNAELLRSLGVEFLIGGEFENELVKIAAAPNPQRLKPLSSGGDTDTAEAVPFPNTASAKISLDRLQFLVPARAGLPLLARYGKLRLPDGSARIVGYTEASRGCKHLCRHCPVVPVYEGTFRIVQPEVVLADIRQQVAAGAQHITFGDPDFFNGPRHALQIVRALHREFPGVSYDVTIKVEHLLKHAEHLRELRETGCAFVTTAVESLDDDVLARLDKGHTRADFLRLVEIMRDAELALSPTFIPFTPWTTIAGYADLLRTLASLELLENVAPVQLSIRLLIPQGSRLLELHELKQTLEGFDQDALSYRWRNPDPRVDELQSEVEKCVADCAREGLTRGQTFELVWALAHPSPESGESAGQPAFKAAPLPARASIPYLTEPWYC
jgi:radical SAM superfamily enzyme YgiQ (UPF0313 family)